MAHEINTPVGVSLTASSHLRERTEHFVELFANGRMKRRYLERFVSVADESCQILESNLHRASELIRSFEQVAVDQSDDATRQFALRTYVEEILTSLKPKLKNRPIDMGVDIDPKLVIHSNPGALSQIVTNLVINSLNHGFDSGEDGQIRISATANDDNVVIDYEDDGRGMDSDTAKRVFEPFFTTKRGKGGSGLGMHILYNLVTQSLGGTVTCDSEPGSGVKFNITFPRKIIRHQEQTNVR